jgi:hypothetical protein
MSEEHAIATLPIPPDPACAVRLAALERVEAEHETMLREVHAKVTNGFGDKIDSVDIKVGNLKTDTNKRIDEMKCDMDRRFDSTDRKIDSLRKSTLTVAVTLIVSGIGFIGTIVAAILTGFFGLIGG